MPLNGASSTSIPLSHLIDAEPTQPGTTIRSGKPWAFGRSPPFIAQTIIVCRSIAFDIGIERMTFGAVGTAPTSSPEKATWTALALTPARFSTSARLTPVQVGQPIPPVGCHRVPLAGG